MQFVIMKFENEIIMQLMGGKLVSATAQVQTLKFITVTHILLTVIWSINSCDQTAAEKMVVISLNVFEYYCIVDMISLVCQ